MKIAVLNNWVPFVRGGAEYLADALVRKLEEYGHEAVLVRLPLRWNPPEKILEHILACRAVRLDRVERAIGLKFPAYYVPHPNKVLWLLHQFRQAYDLWGTPMQDLPGTPEGCRIREVIIHADNRFLPECRRIYTNSHVTGERLRKFNGLASTVLYPPLLEPERFRSTGYGEHIFMPGRINSAKRQHLVVESMRYVRTGVQLVVAGAPETTADRERLETIIRTGKLESRVRLIPRYISEEEKADLFADALACIYIPYDEDSYGYVALEACQASKPVITLHRFRRHLHSGPGRHYRPGCSARPARHRGRPGRTLRGPPGGRPHGPGGLRAHGRAAYYLGSRDREPHHMRIAWFTPFATASAIGRASQLVTDELSRAADVDIWHPAAAELHATRVRTLEIPQDLELLSATLGSYDLAVYNFGNYLPYHREIFEISRRVPGVAVLHDYVMHHFFAAYWLEYRHAPAEYREAMRRCYGPAGEAAAGENPGVWGGNRVVEFPLFEEATRGAYAAVVHSDYMAGCVGQRFPGPVRKLALAYDLPPAPAPRSRQELGVPRDHALLVSVGHVNPNKRILEVIEALAAEADLSRRVTYAVVGPMDPSYGELLLAAVRAARPGAERPAAGLHLRRRPARVAGERRPVHQPALSIHRRRFRLGHRRTALRQAPWW